MEKDYCVDSSYYGNYDDEDEGDDYEDDCSHCAGSGEGGHESLRCEMCKGTGIGRSFPEEYEDNYSEENYDTI